MQQSGDNYQCNNEFIDHVIHKWLRDRNYVLCNHEIMSWTCFANLIALGLFHFVRLDLNELHTIQYYMIIVHCYYSISILMYRFSSFLFHSLLGFNYHFKIENNYLKFISIITMNGVEFEILCINEIGK